MKKVFVVGGDWRYTNWLGMKIVTKACDADLVLFTGGEDVDPHLYEEPVHPKTMFNAERDNYEVEVYCKAVQRGQYLLGICRGSQFLCMMAGGKLVQHQENPSFIHAMQTRNGDELYVTSTHHQAAWPWNLEPETFNLIGWTTGISKFHQGGNQEELVIGHSDAQGRECEVVHYPLELSLGIQSHPEMVFDYYGTNAEVDRYINYCKSLVELLMKNKL